MAKPPPVMLERVCETCSQPFRLPAWRLKWNPSTWCSQTCANRAIGARKLAASASLRAAIVRLYVDEQLTLQAVAERVGLGAIQSVCRHLDHAGIARRHEGKKGPMSPEQRARVIATHPRGEAHPMYHDLPMTEIRTAYEQGATTAALGRRYGVGASTIGKRLKAAGATLRPQGYGRFRTCPDGCVIQSAGEEWVHDWLVAQQIDHASQPVVPWWRTGRLGHKRADFRVGAVFLEIWGLNGNAAYDLRRREKLALYRDHGVTVIEIFPHHVQDEDDSPLRALLG